MAIYLKQFTETPNAGDSVGARIVEMIAKREVRISGEAPLGVPNLIGIGSIAHWSDRHSVLWGCGLIAEHLDVVPPAEVLALRGKLTRDNLVARGIRCGELLGDVGLLLPELFAPAPRAHDIGLVPHYVDRDDPFVDAARRQGVRIVDVCAAPEDYVRELTSCRRILSSSLHGIVFAHAYGIEAAWVRLSDRVHGAGFKFFDYYSSLGVDARDVEMLSARSATLEQMAAKCSRPGVLPDTAALRRALEACASRLDV